MSNFTEAEIAQQPSTWRLLEGIVYQPQVSEFVQPLLKRPEVRIVLTGAGTSAYVGQILAPSLTRLLGRRVEALATTDLVASPSILLAENVPTLLVSFARSGDSPESLAAVQLANQGLSEVHHLVVTCNSEGALASVADAEVLLMPEGTNDRGFAMTSSFTCMLLAGWLALTPEQEGLVERIAAAGEQMLAAAGEWVDRFVSADDGRVVYLGSGALAGLARESSLKLTELTAGSVISWAESSLGFRHGPKAVLRPDTIAVVYLSNDPHTRLYDADIAAELRKELGTERVLTIGGGGDLPVSLVDVDDAAMAAAMVLFAQRFAVGSALALGIGPDNPFPGGEVNRVVRGVTVHAFGA